MSRLSAEGPNAFQSDTVRLSIQASRDQARHWVCSANLKGVCEEVPRESSCQAKNSNTLKMSHARCSTLIIETHPTVQVPWPQHL